MTSSNGWSKVLDGKSGNIQHKRNWGKREVQRWCISLARGGKRGVKKSGKTVQERNKSFKTRYTSKEKRKTDIRGLSIFTVRMAVMRGK